MAKFGKNTIAQTFKFDCDRFLRFQTLENEDKLKLDIKNSDIRERKGIGLMTKEGHKWEEDIYKDLIKVIGNDNLRYPDDLFKEEKEDKLKYIDLLEILKSENIPFAIFEGQFEVSGNILGIKDFKKKYNLNFSRARPDILWIRPIGTNSPLIKEEGKNPSYELHIVDIKLAAEPSLKHFTEVTYYALVLFEFLKENNLTDKFAVSAEGFIWPGNHDSNAFKKLCTEFKENGDPNFVNSALLETLVPVPYEVYQVHVKQFFRDRLTRVLEQKSEDCEWHVSNTCQLCEYLGYCSQKAIDENHLSLIPWLTRSQANIIRKYGIRSVEDLNKAISSNSKEWEDIKKESYQIRADEKAISARVKALINNEVVIINDRKSALMPKRTDMNIYLTVHFDPGTGITFAMGAKLVYFKPNLENGTPPLKEEKTFIVERVDNFNPEVERKRLIELIQTIADWIYMANDDNLEIKEQRKAQGIRDSKSGKARAHIFFWNSTEITQLKRMLERHMDNPDMIESLNLLLDLFPPNNYLPDPDYFESQPGTIVKDVIKNLIGLPLAHDYNLIETANLFFPNTREDGSKYEYRIPYGFSTKMNDQILYERAYEIWKDDVQLTHFNTNPKREARKYTKDEIYEGIKETIKTRINALEHIANKLRENCKEQLILIKSPVSTKKSYSPKIPLRSNQILAFQKLDSISTKIENFQARALPVEERESKFISIRNLRLVNKNDYSDYIKNIYGNIPDWVHVFTFSPDSKDAKIREGSFLLSLLNEDSSNMDAKWYFLLNLSYQEAEKLISEEGLENYHTRKTVSELLNVTLLKMEVSSDIPFLLLKFGDEKAFNFAVKQGFLNLEKPMILDPMVRDFDSKELQNVFEAIGGL